MIGQFGFGCQAKEFLRISEAVKLGPYPFADEAVGAVRPDEPITAEPLDVMCGFGVNGDAARILLVGQEPSAEPHFCTGLGRHSFSQRTRQMILLALDAIGISCLVLDLRQVKLNHFARLTVPPMIDRRLQSAVEQHRRNADLVKHLKRRRMKSGGPQILRAIFTRFDHDRFDARARQQSRHYGANWPRARDQHLASLFSHHARYASAPS